MKKERHTKTKEIHSFIAIKFEIEPVFYFVNQ